MIKKIIICSIGFMALFISICTIFAATLIYSNDNYSISAGTNKKLVNSYNLGTSKNISGNMSAMATDDNGTDQTILVSSYTKTIDMSNYKILKTYTAAIGLGQFFNLGTVPSEGKKLDINNDNAYGCSWKGNIHINLS